MKNYKKKKYKITVANVVIIIMCWILCSCEKREQGTEILLDDVVLNTQETNLFAEKGEKTVNELEQEKVSDLEAEKLEKNQELETKPMCYVYVCGAVNHPGVVVLPEGSRVQDAIEAAGGMTAQAEDTFINLAAKVEDAQKLLVPTKEQAESLEALQSAEENGLVNINQADSSELCTLSGIGESRAADIIAYREEHGNFIVIEDIMKVPGIKESVFHKIKEKITIE